MRKQGTPKLEAPYWPRCGESKLVKELSQKDDPPYPIDRQGILPSIVSIASITKTDAHSRAFKGEHENEYIIEFGSTTAPERLFQMKRLNEFVKSKRQLSAGNVFVVWRRTWVPACFIDGEHAKTDPSVTENGVSKKLQTGCPPESLDTTRQRACLHQLAPELCDEIFTYLDATDLVNVYSTSQKFAEYLEHRIRTVLEVEPKRSMPPEVWEFSQDSERQFVRTVDPELPIGPVDGQVFREVRCPNEFLFTRRLNDPEAVWANHHHQNDTDLVLRLSLPQLRQLHLEKPRSALWSPRDSLLTQPPATSIVVSMKVYERPRGLETTVASWHIEKKAGVRLGDILSIVVARMDSVDDRLPLLRVSIPRGVCPTPEERELVNLTGRWESMHKAIVGNSIRFGPVHALSAEEVEKAMNIVPTSAPNRLVQSYVGDTSVTSRFEEEDEDLGEIASEPAATRCFSD